MRRFLSVFLHDDSQPDTVFAEDPYRGLITISDNGPFSRLTQRHPRYSEPGALA